MCCAETPAREVHGVPLAMDVTPADSVVHRQAGGSPVHGGIPMGKGNGLGGDIGKEPGKNPRRQEVGNSDRRGDHGGE